MAVDINLETGKIDLRVDERDNAFAFAQQNLKVNEYLQEQLKHDGKKSRFDPFQASSDPSYMSEVLDIEAQIASLGSFNIKAAELNDDKSQMLYEQLNPGADKKALARHQEKIRKNRYGEKPKDGKEKDVENEQEEKDQAKSRSEMFTMLDSSLSTRLQSENPFDDFRQAVEKAIIEKSKVVRKKFDYDKEFFGEKDDTNMCISMHQPWASLMVHGFKRFEGRAWTTKYRGPLWVHATSQKPDPDQIDLLESLYAEHYSQVGEDIPAFPTRYPTGVVIGRVDLVDVLSIEQYKDTVPDVL